jgi:methylenetetrahydrofolate reductase (NADPH)
MKRLSDFLDKSRAIGIIVLIVPGLKPITTQNHIQFLPKTFCIDLSSDLYDGLEKCKNNAAMK